MTPGRIHSTESFGSVDGPGVRFMIFTQGCAMRCRYCHNPDTWDTAGGELMSAVELLDRAERYRGYWGREGGITVSGGEPLLQVEFLTELFQEAKKRSIHTCIDTAGQPFTRNEPFFSGFAALCEYTDLFLADIKHIDPEQHKMLTGRDNGNILDMLRYLSDIEKPVWIRYVLVPGLTDGEEYLRKTGEFIAALGNVQRVEVLPYHSMGAFKWKELGVPYTLDDTASPSRESVEQAKKLLALCKK